MTIDRSSPLPLYYQLKRILLAKLESGELQPGDMVPTEQRIQEIYNVSRTTVRQALSELEDDGKITRHRGRGTFVAEPKVHHIPEEYPNLADHMLQQGMRPGWRLLKADWVTPTDKIINKLRLKDNRKVYHLERLRLSNDEPIGYHSAFVAPDYAEAIDHSALTEGGSLRYLRHLGQVLETCIADRSLEAVAANQRISQLLGITVGSAVLRINRLVYTKDRQPVEVFLGIYRGDRFQYHINNMRAMSSGNY